MEVTNDALEWTTEDIDLWAQFLQTRAGSRLVPKLLESTPILFEDGDTNKLLIRTGKVVGFADAARTLLNLAQHTPAPARPITTHPDLEDDSAWNDGKKALEVPTTIE